MTVVHFTYTDDKPLTPKPIRATPMPKNGVGHMLWGAAKVWWLFFIMLIIVYTLKRGH